MSRLADYFVVVGYDYEKGRNGQKGAGKILQRFPEQDWDNCSFTQGIELFCQPTGWTLSTQKREPTFFISALTDIDAERHYGACLTFSEDVATLEPLGGGEDDEGEDEVVGGGLFPPRGTRLYAPKSLVLVSRLHYFETFRNCLGIIYAVHAENMGVSFETMIGNVLGSIPVPPPGGPQIRFSIGADDRQCLQPPMSATLPVTGAAVALLFEQLGISNTLMVFCAALSDHKVLFHSQSYSRLTDTSHALTALMYPLKYSYVYIPLLPIGLLEVLNTPTPFIAGVHTTLKPELSELLDVVVADLDGGSVKLPENVHIALLPEPILSRTIQSLQLILRPDLIQADLAFPPSPVKKQPPDMMDKEIRAVFLRMFAELFFGYRSCLTIIRIHPDPVITFHKANFLGHRSLVEDEFVTRVLDSMSFNAFVVERGPPYRVCDIFDEVFSSLQDTLRGEEASVDRQLQNIRDLAHKLFLNENPTSQAYTQKIPRPTDGAHLRVHQPVFPRISAQKVAQLIEEGMARVSLRAKPSPVWQQYARIVPMGTHVALVHDRARLIATNARRLEVLRNCVALIFDSRISDARKIFPAVLRALKSKVARLALVDELSDHVKSNRALLDHQQFDLVVRLLNSALQNDSCLDEHGVAAAILPLATAFCRKLFTGVIQFAYTCVQEHAVWGSLQFWETCFYQDVQLQIRQLYLPQYEAATQHTSPTKEIKEGGGGWRKEAPSSSDPRRWSATHLGSGSISALEIAAEQLRIWPNQSAEGRREMIDNEESTVFSQAIHYANRIVFLRVPLDANRRARDAPLGGATEGGESVSGVTNSVAESDSYDAESGFEEQEVSEVGSSVGKFVTRFVDKACAEGGVSADHVKALHLMIPGVIAMHLETIEAVYLESKRLPPIQKPKILTPTLLAGEEMVMEGLRVYLIPDGREEGTGGALGGPVLLPAEGGIFLTTYRIIFKGTPCDPLACEQVVVRSFPISSLTKEKKLSAQCLSHINQWLQEAIQLRSCTFQLMRMAFDDEVSLDDVETLRKLLLKLRNPPSVSSTFAFSCLHALAQPLQLHRTKAKNASLKGFAKRTLMKTARRAGFVTKDSGGAGGAKGHKFVTPPQLRRTGTGTDPLGSLRHENAPMFDDDLSVIDEAEIQSQIQTDARNIDRLAERPYCRDYQRLGLGTLSHPRGRSPHEGFRLTLANTAYGVCASYPAILVVPQAVSDDSILKFARSHRQNRFPVVTWRHPTTRAVLLRGSGFHGKGVMGLLKGHYNTPAGASGTDSSTSVAVEQEKYFSALVSATPMVESALNRCGSPLLPHRGSIASIQGVGAAVGSAVGGVFKKDQAFQRILGSIRGPARGTRSTRGAHSPPRVGGGGDANLRGMSLRDSRRTSSAGPQSRHLGDHGSPPGPPKRAGPSGSETAGGHEPAGHAGLHRAALYVLGEKTQMKGIRSESLRKVDFIPVDYPEIRAVKSSFKKLLRACVPSDPPSPAATSDPPGGGGDQRRRGFLRAVEESDWLGQIRSVLQIAGAAVDLLDAQGSSVMVCLEDGWDLATQVLSVAQLLLDPYYRTLEGFRTLVDKEWMAFGHRFTHRSNQTVETQASGFAPIFLQFLDVVHQIQAQFPLSFEFNEYYLRFLAYHHVSNRFRSFMLDTEQQRVDAGWMLLDSAEPPPGGCGAEPTTPSEGGAGGLGGGARGLGGGASVWEYVEAHGKRAPVFYNFRYSPHCGETVLRPCSSVPLLRVWEYYLGEDLAHGPTFDLEVVEADRRLEAEQEMIDGAGAGSGGVGGAGAGGRSIVNAGYDDVRHLQPESCAVLLTEIERLERELSAEGVLPSPHASPSPQSPSPPLQRMWKQTWDSLLEASALRDPHGGPREAQSPWLGPSPEGAARHQGRAAHKRSTMDLLVRGKILGGDGGTTRRGGAPVAHRFERFHFVTAAHCDHCSQLLWGVVKTGMRCADCGYNSHDKCVTLAPKNCNKLRLSSDLSGSEQNLSRESDAASTMVADPSSRDGETFLQFSTNQTEHRTHEGYLWKRGALLKGWKQRWFVLDSMKHQIRYYDTREDNSSKDCIELTDVVSVQSIKNVQGAPKKADENAFFELKTSKRTYNFLAADHKAAQEWIDRLQFCIQ